MRAALILVVLAAATPVVAQQLFVPSLELDSLRLEQEATQRRMIEQQHLLMAVEARARAEQAALQLQLQRELPARVPAQPYDPTVPLPGRTSLKGADYPTTPDAALADSNRKVQDAARNRR